MRASTTLLTAAGLTALLHAQSVHVVGPTGYAEIRDALAIAAPGDVIEVESGTYLDFACNVGVTIVARPGARVDVRVRFFAGFGTTSFRVPPGQLAAVRGLHFRNPGLLQDMEVHVLGGAVVFDACSFEGSLSIAQLLLVQDAAAWLRGCTAIAGYAPGPCPAVRALRSTVAAVDCTILGSDLTVDGTLRAGDGIHATASALHLVRCIVTGGSANALCFYPPADAVRIESGVGSWIADSTLTGGNGYCMLGGDALRNNGAVVVHLSRTKTVPGPGTPPGNATTGPIVATDLPGLASMPSSLQLGAQYVVDCRIAPGTPVVLLLGRTVPARSRSEVVEPLWLAADAAGVLGLRVGDPLGIARFTTAVPAVPQLVGVVVSMQALAGIALPLHATPPVGGVVR
ncbi:MAG: hypothetical protein IPM29_28670 [Planctomycetes bacterium]|nr:hypothetical protein [Planctomycetota bacterium]